MFTSKRVVYEEFRAGGTAIIFLPVMRARKHCDEGMINADKSRLRTRMQISIHLRELHSDPLKIESC